MELEHNPYNSKQLYPVFEESANSRTIKNKESNRLIHENEFSHFIKNIFYKIGIVFKEIYNKTVVAFCFTGTVIGKIIGTPCYLISSLFLWLGKQHLNKHKLSPNTFNDLNFSLEEIINKKRTIGKLTIDFNNFNEANLFNLDNSDFIRAFIEHLRTLSKFVDNIEIANFYVDKYQMINDELRTHWNVPKNLQGSKSVIFDQKQEMDLTVLIDFEDVNPFNRFTEFTEFLGVRRMNIACLNIYINGGTNEELAEFINKIHEAIENFSIKINDLNLKIITSSRDNLQAIREKEYKCYNKVNSIPIIDTDDEFE